MASGKLTHGPEQGPWGRDVAQCQVVLKRRVVESQNRRLFIFDVLSKGRTTSWDYQPIRDASRAYVRNVGAEEDEVKGRARYPFVAPRPPDVAG